MTLKYNWGRNQALDRLRRADYRAQEEEWNPDKDFRMTTDNPAALAETSEEMQRVLGCLGLLGEEQRDCILLSYHQGLTPTEVAAKLTRQVRSEERRVGKECVSTCRSRGSQYH